MSLDLLPRSAPLAVLLLPALALAEPCPFRVLWPTEEWHSRTAEIASTRAAEIAALEAYAFTLVGKDEERRGVRTNAVVIVKDGSILYERYARGFAAAKRHLTWSVSKSVINALTGLAVGEGALALDDSICEHVNPPRPESCRITVKDLLEFASGLAWTEHYENRGNQASSVLAMLYGEGHRDMVSFIAGHAPRDPPGTTYQYSSGDTTLLAGVVDAALRPRTGEEYPWKLLFDVVGMRSAVFERDARGVPVGSSRLFATPQDMARFGFLYLNDGCWEVGRVLPEDWVRDSTSVSSVYRLRPLAKGGVQGRGFWLNRPVPEQNVSRAWPDAPEDAFAALGHWGQSITIIPSLDMVVVRVADDREPGAYDHNRFLSLAIAVGR